MEAGNGVTSSRSRRGGHLTESVPTTSGWRARGPKKSRPGVTPRRCGRRAGVLKGTKVRPRRRANTQDRKSLLAAWQDLPWTKGHRQVFRLPKRMYQATPRGPVTTGHQRPNLWLQSWSARWFAGRRVRQDNRGQHTAGGDGTNSFTPAQRLRRAGTLHLTSTATPLRRTGMPKRGSPETRPLGIPTQHDRARQTLLRQALEPEWEAQWSPPTDGFRPGRACWDASAAVFHRSKVRPQDRLTVEMAQGVDRLDHSAFLATRQAPPDIRRPGRAG